MIDIREIPGVIDTLNGVINNDLIAEVKIERDRDSGLPSVIVVEQSRRIRIRKTATPK